MPMLTQRNPTNPNQIKTKPGLRGKGHKMGMCVGQLVFSPATVLYDEEVSFAADQPGVNLWVENTLLMTCSYIDFACYGKFNITICIKPQRAFLF